jgi:hypothetical protein
MADIFLPHCAGPASSLPSRVGCGRCDIDHALSTMNYRSLRTNEALTTQVNFYRLPMAPRNEGNRQR